MKRLLFSLAILALLQCSCMTHSSTGDAKSKLNDTTGASADPASVDGVNKLPFTDTIDLKANDDMHFNKDLFKVRHNTNLILRLTNTGAQTTAPMVHNVVILSKGTDIATFADEARNHQDEQYIPKNMASSIIAHTSQVSAGKSNQVAFKINSPGVYNFICSYPGHWGTMQGQIAVF